MLRIILAKTAGSTLIELTVVVAIIASLAAMAVPTFIAYRDRSRVAQAISSSETIRAALASYAAKQPREYLSLDRHDYRFRLLAACGE